MNVNLIFINFLTPPILFFFLGICAILLRVDLRIPKEIAKFFSLYLMLAIGFHGGVELSNTPLTWATFVPLLIAIISTLIIPLYTFFILKTRLNVYDAAAIAATYGSVSSVTFITAVSFLNTLAIPYGGQMVAALALMEAPAIIIGLLLVRLYAPTATDEDTPSIWHEALLNSSTYLILGSLLIGILTGSRGEAMIAPFTHDIFKGILCFFMLDMGLLAAKRLDDLKEAGLFLVGWALGFPLINATIALLLSALCGLSTGDAFLLTVLCASASYIAVPAAMRMSLPEANPSLYITMALGLTFTFNILFGLPLYLNAVKFIVGS
ncbi:MAG: sodium-dependent bicarbonate transport family permease [Candidatus Babeliales bacterium]